MHRYVLAALAALSISAVVRGTVIDFSDQSLPPDSYNNGGPNTNSTGFTSGGAYLNNSYTNAGGYGYWNGWSLSTVNNTGTDYPTVPDYGGNHAYAAIPGGAVSGPGAVYAVGYWDGYDPTYINLPAGQAPVSVDLTNTTDDVLSMEYGDSFGAKAFGPSDYFYVTLTGYTGPGGTGSSTGAQNFYLAQNGTIVQNWTSVNLGALGNASSIGFTFTSSDVGEFGINTPTYVALDDLTTTAVPEPVTVGALAMVGASMLSRRSRRSIATAKE